MRLLRHGPAGRERPGLLAADGTIRDLSGVVADIGPAQLAPGMLDSLRQVDPAGLPAVDAAVRLGPPLAGVGKIVGIGLNYRDHARESGMPAPPEPVVFMKATSCLCGPDDPLRRPDGSTKLDYEVELAVVIGTLARDVPVEAAPEYVAGYAVMNDVSERQWQLERGTQWDKGKGADGFGPLGPWLVTADEVPDPQNLRLWCDVDGERRQNGTTADMIFSVAELISYVSRFMSLHPGDIITTGTPAGVGMGFKPEPRYLQPGQRVLMGVEGLGEQRTTVV
jgi:2,4-diketo-3-deoxy-L-fuconate hydrolase